MSAAALEARGVVKRFGDVLALDAVDLAVSAGEAVALVGESGSGKTTLLRTFNRMVEPDTGSSFVNGTNVAEQDPVALRRSLGYVQQEGGLMPHWTVLRNVALVPTLQGLSDASERARQALDLVGLEPARFAARWPRELSGGQRQRAALARALAAEPEVILLDEPFGALDAITRSELQGSFHDLIRRVGVTVLLVTHDLREAFALCDRVAVMCDGRIDGIGPPADLVAEPGTPYVAELLQRAGVA